VLRPLAALLHNRYPPARLLRQARLLLVVLATTLTPLAAGGCARDYIPNTDVPNNEANRKIIVFCERYRKAVEKQNVSELLKLASPKYYEDGGNVDASDDIDYAGLEAFLRKKFLPTTDEQGRPKLDKDGRHVAEVKKIRYEIKYRRIQQPDERLIFVDYTYSASYVIPNERGEDEWHRKVDDNRLELEVLDNGEMRILAGM